MSLALNNWALGICSPLIYSIVSNDSVSSQGSLEQTVRMGRLIWAVAVCICPKARFRMVAHIAVMLRHCFWISVTFIQDKQTIHTKCQGLFSLKNNFPKNRISSATFLLRTSTFKTSKFWMQMALLYIACISMVWLGSSLWSKWSIYA